jgi:hypothetical protein
MLSLFSQSFILLFFLGGGVLEKNSRIFYYVSSPWSSTGILTLSLCLIKYLSIKIFNVGALWEVCDELHAPTTLPVPACWMGARADLDFCAEKNLVPSWESNSEFAVIQLAAESRCFIFQSKLEIKK